MGQSLVRNFLHITFSTKHRVPLIKPDIEDDLFNYLGGICRNKECYPVIVGGHLDHVHILCQLSKKIALMDLMEELKAHSSKWMKTQRDYLEHFYWQNGYGAFSVYPQDIEVVERYIRNQRAHHTKVSFQDEYREFLGTYKVEYDERYVWD